MIASGTLGLLEAMADGPIADLEPVLGSRTGAIRYPDAEEHLANGEHTLRTLDALADRGVLERTFREKVHRCPECELRELHYTTVCPGCGSPETTGETPLEHAACGYTATRERLAEADDCPGCGTFLEANASELTTVGERHRCLSCTRRFAEPESRLRCRRCSGAWKASRVPETVVYGYCFAESRREWLYARLAACGAVGDVLRRRGFETTRNERVIGASGLEYVLDLYGTDAERGLAVVAAVVEDPTAADVIDFHAASIDVDAYPTLLLTGDTPTEAVCELAERLDVGLLRPTEPREPALSCETPWSAEPSL